MEMIMLMVLLFLVFVLFVFFAVRSGRIQNLLKKYPQLPKYMVLGYTVFCGCFEYPLLNRHSSTISIIISILSPLFSDFSD